MKVNIQKLHPKAVTPMYANSTDAGMDITCVSFDVCENIITYKTGIAMEIPSGYVGLLFPRSSVYKQCLQLANSVGVVDSGYRGEIMFKYRITSDGSFYNIGERVGQIVIMPYPKVEFNLVESLTDSDRGQGGFGSTGK